MSPTAEYLTQELSERYEVERELGRGASAVVYLATDLKHGRKVALKLLAASEQAVSHERFLLEIRTTARLHHPHLLPLYDSGHAGERLFFSMPYIEAGSLRDRLRRDRKLPLPVALRIVEQAGRALAYAHSQGIIHRDVKPENILLSPAGDALVTDFGIAYAFDGARRELSTAEDMVVGTPIYMSPEQMQGARNLDARTDLYSLACVLFEMLAGEPPFLSRTTRELMHRRLHEDPPPIRVLVPEVPVAVERALIRALARKRDDRFESIAELLVALAEPSTFRVLTLGGLTMMADDRTIAEDVVAPHAMALLALLANSQPHGVQPEQAMRLLWPSADEETARRRLERAVRALRLEIGLADAIASGRTITLRGGSVTSDVSEFRDALDAGDVQHALALYGGPFLEGFRLDDAPAFNVWVRAIRDDLAMRQRAALEHAARAATKRRDHAHATLWWRRLAQEEPLNGRVTRGLMLALAASGDRAGAIRQADVFEALIEQELGLPPDHEVLALAESIRSGTDVAPLAETLEHEAAPSDHVQIVFTKPGSSWLAVVAIALALALLVALGFIFLRSTP